ncbi:MAG: diguanylate cyclase [Acidimicrobiia bacterium]|nr:diguanylate cyclase [Acidimicrobiia bacterium]
MSTTAPSRSENDNVRSRRLTALAEINLVGKVSSADVLEQVAQLATELLPASLGASAVLADSDGTFPVVATTVAGQTLGSEDNTLRKGGATSKIFDTLEPVVIGDIKDDPLGKGSLAKKFGVKAYVGVPIAIDGRCLGVLYVLDDEPRTYTDDEVAFLRLLAGRAAAAVHHAGIFAEMRLARERSEALAWVANAVIAAVDLAEVLESVVEGVAAAVSADEVEVMTVDRDLTRIISHARSGMKQIRPDLVAIEGIAEVALREARVVITPAGEAPSVVAPLRAGGSVLGALLVQRSNALERFDESEIDLIVAMANQVAIAIDNVRLLDTTRSTLRETEAMYSMSQALVAGADLPEMMDAVAIGAVEAVPAAGARVLMADESELTAQAVAGIAKDAEWDEILSGEVGRVLRSSELIHDPHHLVVPLVVHGRLLGVLEAMNEVDSPEFSIHQLGTLQAAAAQAAVAIENHLLFGEVQRLAITDELTGVNSRRHLFELGQREFAQSVRFRKPLSAIMFDLDHFKDINDTLGHLVGDEVLEGVASRCANVLREVDVLGRYGGEEFAVILPDASSTDAAIVAERVRRAVADEPVETAKGPVAVTVSLGVAEVGPGVLDLKTLLDRADAAMYSAKEAGRDQVMAA